MDKTIDCDKMMQLYMDSIAILEDKDNYESDNNINKLNTARNVFDNVVKELSKGENDLSKLTEELSSSIKYMKNVSADMNKLLIFMTELNNMKNTDICNKFESSISIEQINKLGKELDLSQILKMYICKTCNNAITVHKCCNKFEKINVDVNDGDYELKKNMCKTCGVEPENHHACNLFVYKLDNNKKLITKCETCGLDHLYHIITKTCDKFVDNEFGYCSECNHHITEHFYNQKFKKLTKKNIVIQNHLQLTLATIVSKENIYRMLVDDLNNKIHSENYTELVKLVNNKGYHMQNNN